MCVKFFSNRIILTNLKPIYYIICIIFALPILEVQAQNGTSVSIKAQATVIDKSEIELVTIKNMDIDLNNAKNGRIYVSAKYHPEAAQMMVKGKANARFRVTFAPVVEISNSAGTGTLKLHYEMFGNQKDNQGASEPIDAVARTLQISSESKYFFWVGSQIDITNARPGTYNGEFTIEIEYI